MENKINIEKIKTYIMTEKMTRADFCKKCNVGLSTFYRIMSGKDFHLIFLFRIAKEMGVEINELFNE